MPHRDLLNNNIPEDKVRKQQEEEVFNRKLQAVTTGRSSSPDWVDSDHL
jgi:hypothetical protein